MTRGGLAGCFCGPGGRWWGLPRWPAPCCFLLSGARLAVGGVPATDSAQLVARRPPPAAGKRSPRPVPRTSMIRPPTERRIIDDHGEDPLSRAPKGGLLHDQPRVRARRRPSDPEMITFSRGLLALPGMHTWGTEHTPGPGHVAVPESSRLPPSRPRAASTATDSPQADGRRSWRTARPAARSSRAAGRPARATSPVCRRSTGSLPAFQSRISRGMSRAGAAEPM